MVEAPGARTATGQVTTGRVPVPENAVSSTTTPVRSTLPGFVTSKLYVTVAPAVPAEVGSTDLTRMSAAVAGMVTTAVEGGEVTASPDGGVPLAVAVSVTDPASTS